MRWPVLAQIAGSAQYIGRSCNFKRKKWKEVAVSSLDTIDLRILEELQKDGRISNAELADRVGLSPSPCLRRVRQLEAAGILRGYVGLVDPEALGFAVTAFVRVRLDGQDDRHLATFETSIMTFPEVMECYLMTGESDYQLRVLVTSLAEFEDFLRHKLTRIEGVSQVTSSFALRPIVYRTALSVKSGAITLFRAEK